MTHADTYGLAVFADTPVAWYRLDETSGTSAADEMGGAAGTHVSATTTNQSPLIPTGFGKAGVYISGFNLDTSTTTLGTFGTNLLTSSYEFWVKTTVATGPQAAFGVVMTGTANLMACYINSVNEAFVSGSVEFHFRGNGANTLKGSVSSTINDGNPHHVVCVITSASTFDVWIDGVQKSVTYSVQQSMVGGTNIDFPMMLGARNVRGVADRFFDGTLDEVAFYSSQLSGARIQAHYAAAQAPASPSSGVVGRKYIDQPGVYGAGRRR